jgi:hypothetical protein
MTELEKLTEFNALICEAQAMSLDAEAMKEANRERKMKNESSVYTEVDFMFLAKDTRAIADKLRKLGA